jgi:hypothetical protein
LHSRQHIKLSKIFSSDDFLYHWFCQYSDQPSSCTSALVSVRYSNSHFISIKKKRKKKNSHSMAHTRCLQNTADHIQNFRLQLKAWKPT